MGLLLVLGCVCIAFGPPAAAFLFVVARDPLRVILFVLGAFFWLCSLFLSSFTWLATYPIRDSHIWISLIFNVLFQEVVRIGFFALLKVAESGLTKVAAQGMHIQGVHSLINARHIVAFVCGLGYGVMGGLFALTNVLADSRGPGVPGLPDALGDDPYPTPFGTPYFFPTVYSLCAVAVMMLQVCWTVICWNGLHHWRLYRSPEASPNETPREPKFMCHVEVLVTVLTHYVVVFCSLMNEHGYWPLYLALLYALLLFNVGWSLNICGFKLSGLRKLRVRCDKNAQESNDEVTSGDRQAMVVEVRASESPATGGFIRFRLWFDASGSPVAASTSVPAHGSHETVVRQRPQQEQQHVAL